MKKTKRETKEKKKNVETPKGGVLFFLMQKGFHFVEQLEKTREGEQMSRDTAGHTNERERREEACTKINIKRMLNQKTDEK